MDEIKTTFENFHGNMMSEKEPLNIKNFLINTPILKHKEALPDFRPDNLIELASKHGNSAPGNTEITWTILKLALKLQGFSKFLSGHYNRILENSYLPKFWLGSKTLLFQKEKGKYTIDN